MPIPAASTAPTPARLALRALLTGWAAAVPLLAVGLLAGLPPAGALAAAAAGGGLALLVPVLLLPVQRWFLGRKAGEAGTTTMLKASLQAGFVAKLLAVGLGVLVLSLAGAKFELLAAFALAFLAVALVSQLASAWYLARALARRSPAAAAGGAPVPAGSRPPS